mmetsp:Transcript_83016/g.216697  ORF Transcript_83016/g.216697 Transcript_83016/m.216697 type:complete len:224 (-) Transcript_83016:201-872(-)
MGLDYLQALVHHCRRVDSDLGAHVPIRVRRRPLSQHLWVGRLHLFDGHVPERAAAARQDNLLDAVLRHALHALEDRRVLRVDGEHVHAILLEHRRDHGAASDQGLLVRQGDVLASFDGLYGGYQASAADDASDDGLRFFEAGHGNLPVLTSHHFRLGVAQTQSFDAGVQLVDHRLVAGDKLRLELLDLLKQEGDVLAGRQCHGLEEARMLPADVEGLRADAAS